MVSNIRTRLCIQIIFQLSLAEVVLRESPLPTDGFRIIVWIVLFSIFDKMVRLPFPVQQSPLWDNNISVINLYRNHATIKGT